MYLTAREGRSNIGEIADYFGISKDHLAKVAQRLAKEGFVRSIRGIGGGLELAVAPAELSLGEVIERIEGSLHLLDCVAVSDICRIQPACALRGVLAKAEQVQSEYLRSVKLSDIVQPAADLVQWSPTPPSPKKKGSKK